MSRRSLAFLVVPIAIAIAACVALVYFLSLDDGGPSKPPADPVAAAGAGRAMPQPTPRPTRTGAVALAIEPSSAPDV